MTKLRALSIGLCIVAALEGCATEARETDMWRSPSGVRPSFHHIHINDPAPADLVKYYERLFDRSTTRPITLGTFHGVEAGGVYLLITAVQRPPSEEGSAGWHFGWGTVSLDEPYDRHRMQEIEWELPLASFARNLHLHVESEQPITAGEWYRDRFGAALAASTANASVQPVNAWYRRPVAIVRLEGVALAIYKAVRPLQPSRGHRIDHLAFTVPDLGAARDALSAAGVKVLEDAGRLGAHDTMMIEAPDRLAIELIGPAALRR